MHLFNYLIQFCINISKLIFVVNKNDIASLCNFYHYINQYENIKTSENCFVKNKLSHSIYHKLVIRLYYLFLNKYQTSYYLY